MGLSNLPHLPGRGIFEPRQMSSRIGGYSGKTSSLYPWQVRQSINLGCIKKFMEAVGVKPTAKSQITPT